MASAKVEQGQCLMDVAVQYCGSATAIFEIAELNGIEITALLNAGDEVIIPAAYQAMVNYLVQKQARPAIGKGGNGGGTTDAKGIGWMRIGTTFMVH